jgi:type I restriction enzyme S subunit
MTTLAEELGGAQRIIGGPFGSNLTQADYQDVGVPVIRGSNMEFNGRYIGGTFTYVSVDKATTSLRSNIARPGDIIVTQRGTMGQVSIIPSDMEYEYFVISQSQMAISVPSDTADSLFVYYFLRSQGFLDYLHTSTIQTGVPHINLTILRQTPVQWPPLHSQQAISAVLGALDDKIELNWRMNETLEATARAIFKDWFVDFDPTRSKQEGRAPYLARDIWSLFPGRLDDEGKPEGWTFERISTLGRLFRETLSPAAPPDDLFDHYSLPAYDAGAEPIIERGGRILSNKTLVPSSPSDLTDDSNIR